MKFDSGSLWYLENENPSTTESWTDENFDLKNPRYEEEKKIHNFALRPFCQIRAEGLCPCTPPGALRRAPGPHPKSARASALAMCAPRTCLPPPPPKKIGFCPPKKIGSRLRARYVRSAHMFAQKKSDPSNSNAHVCPPIINRCPLLAPPPPLFKSWCRHWLRPSKKPQGASIPQWSILHLFYTSNAW